MWFSVVWRFFLLFVCFFPSKAFYLLIGASTCRNHITQNWFCWIIFNIPMFMYYSMSYSIVCFLGNKENVNKMAYWCTFVQYSNKWSQNDPKCMVLNECPTKESKPASEEPQWRFVPSANVNSDSLRDRLKYIWHRCCKCTLLLGGERGVGEVRWRGMTGAEVAWAERKRERWEGEQEQEQDLPQH